MTTSFTVRLSDKDLKSAVFNFLREHGPIEEAALEDARIVWEYAPEAMGCVVTNQ